MENTKVDHFELAKSLHKRHARITFEEIKETDDTLIIRVTQTRSPHNNHATKERLAEIGHELYILKEGFNKKLTVHTVPYVEPPSEHVNADWVKLQMQKLKIGSKGLIEDIGLSKSDVSALINGHKEMGVRTKALFYYYFMFREATQVPHVTKSMDQCLVERMEKVRKLNGIPICKITDEYPVKDGKKETVH